MGNSKNRLHIETDELEIELSGEADAVLEAYDELRDSLRDLYSSADRGAMVSANHPAVESQDGGDDHDPNDTLTPSGVVEDADPDRSSYVRLVLRRDEYEKIILFDVGQLARSFLGETLDPANIDRVYCHEAVEKRLRRSVDLGETIWRKLTEDGQKAIEDLADVEQETS